MDGGIKVNTGAGGIGGACPANRKKLRREKAYAPRLRHFIVGEARDLIKKHILELAFLSALPTAVSSGIKAAFSAISGYIYFGDAFFGVFLCDAVTVVFVFPLYFGLFCETAALYERDFKEDAAPDLHGVAFLAALRSGGCAAKAWGAFGALLIRYSAFFGGSYLLLRAANYLYGFGGAGLYFSAAAVSFAGLLATAAAVFIKKLYLVPYIIYKEPALPRKEAAKLSARAMKGKKAEAYFFDLGFLWLFACCLLTPLLLGAALVTPYYLAVRAVYSSYIYSVYLNSSNGPSPFL